MTTLPSGCSATAREFGGPAMPETGSATRRIADGDWVIVDGTAGTAGTAEVEKGSG
jgi:hypothetical protein